MIDMGRKQRVLVGTLGALCLISAQSVHADPTPPIDWKQLEEITGGTGDHIVGEELCFVPQGRAAMQVI
jgi:hypothetical protein